VDELLSIGDFSARGGLSAKMLRSYAAAGLLVPAAVDGSWGYRYYSTSQLHQARVIALLRHAEIAVDDISTSLSPPTSNSSIVGTARSLRSRWFVAKHWRRPERRI
jgi:DNA-binding transcriptional MerR regulator